ncbi:alpha/beta-hydrolase [Pilatotrama ljubarskyi]|nr:alpha/beta-hydrolase [Pilatotrama ljubarskyi]
MTFTAHASIHDVLPTSRVRRAAGCLFSPASLGQSPGSALGPAHPRPHPLPRPQHTSAMAYRTSTVSPLFPSRQVKSGLHFVAKCYVPEDRSPAGVTLLFFHCAGSHKEAWEPTLDAMVSVLESRAEGSPIREVWAFDMQSHGEAACLNHKALEESGAKLSVEDYAEGFQAFCASGTLVNHRLIAIGHSLGATAMLLALMEKNPPVTFESMILVEPALITKVVYDEHLEEREGALKTMSIAIMKRRDTWNTREEAKEYFQKRFPWMIWDPRIIDRYVRHGLREIQVEEGGVKVTKVTLCCTKLQERMAYTYESGSDAPHFRVVAWLQSLSPPPKMHFISGERADLVPEYIHKSMIDLGIFSSVQKVPAAGHFVVQEQPDGLGKAIAQALMKCTSRARL